MVVSRENQNVQVFYGIVDEDTFIGSKRTHLPTLSRVGRIIEDVLEKIFKLEVIQHKGLREVSSVLELFLSLCEEKLIFGGLIL